MTTDFKTKILSRTYAYSIKLLNLIKTNDIQTITNSILLNQLLRSGTSIGANVFEAQGSPSDKDFCNYLSIALKSANETKYWLGLVKDCNIIEGNLVDPILDETKEISKILGAIVATLKNKRATK